MNKNLKLKFNIIYICIQAIFLAAACALQGYNTVYIRSLGFSNSVVGVILSTMSVVGLVVQPIAASFVDKHREISIQKIIIFVCIVSGGLSLLLYAIPGPVILKLAMYLLTILVFGVSGPLVSSLAFIFEKDGVQIDYGVARSAGSGAWAVAQFFMGTAVAKFGMNIMFVVYTALVGVLAVLILAFNIKGETRKEKVIEVKEETKTSTYGEFFVKYKYFMIFIAGSSMVLFAHSTVNTYFINIVEQFGGTTEELGKAMSLAAAVEIPGMILYERLCKKFTTAKVMIFACLSFIVKYVVTLLASNMTMVFVAEVLQMFSYALFTPSTVYIGRRSVDEVDIVKGQTLVSMVQSFASIFASLVGGFALDLFGVNAYIMIATIVCAVGTVVVSYALKMEKDRL